MSVGPPHPSGSRGFAVEQGTADRTAANLATVQDIYAAFARGDILAILDVIADDCRWEAWVDNSAQRGRRRNSS